MDISDFISDSIEEITKGLLKAQTRVSAHGVDIKTNGAGGYSDIDFDIAVTSRQDKDLGGEAKLSVLGLDLKFGKGGEDISTVASRIKFSVAELIPSKNETNILQDCNFC